MTPPPEYVFGYGSLAALPAARLTRMPAAHGFVADLHGHARGWGVAMDNRVDLPGYKHYTAADGSRPAVHVCFLDLARDPRAAVNGACLPVDGPTLDTLDARERNYDRVEVSDAIVADADIGHARVWAYVGSSAGRGRFRRGLARGDAVIAAAYLDGVRRAFDALGEREARACAASLEPGGLPVAELIRRDRP